MGLGARLAAVPTSLCGGQASSARGCQAARPAFGTLGARGWEHPLRISGGRGQEELSGRGRTRSSIYSVVALGSSFIISFCCRGCKLPSRAEGRQANLSLQARRDRAQQAWQDPGVMSRATQPRHPMSARVSCATPCALRFSSTDVTTRESGGGDLDFQKAMALTRRWLAPNAGPG